MAEIRARLVEPTEEEKRALGTPVPGAAEARRRGGAAIGFVNQMRQQLNQLKQVASSPREQQMIAEREAKINQAQSMLVERGVAIPADFMTTEQEAVTEAFHPFHPGVASGLGGIGARWMKATAGKALPKAGQEIGKSVSRLVTGLEAQAGLPESGSGIHGAALGEAAGNVALSMMPGGTFGQRLLRHTARPALLGGGAGLGYAIDKRMRTGETPPMSEAALEAAMTAALPVAQGIKNVALESAQQLGSMTAPARILQENRAAEIIRKRAPKAFRSPGTEAISRAYNDVYNSNILIPSYGFKNNISEYLEKLPVNLRNRVHAKLQATLPAQSVGKALPKEEALVFNTKTLEEFMPGDPSSYTKGLQAGFTAKHPPPGTRTIINPARPPRAFLIGELDAWRQALRRAADSTGDEVLFDALTDLKVMVDRHIDRSLADPNILRYTANKPAAEIAKKLDEARRGHFIEMSAQNMETLIKKPSITKMREDLPRARLLGFKPSALRNALDAPQSALEQDVVDRLGRVGALDDVKNLLTELENKYFPYIGFEVPRQQGFIATPYKWFTTALLTPVGRKLLGETLIEARGFVPADRLARIANASRRSLDEMLKGGEDKKEMKPGAAVTRFGSRVIRSILNPFD